MSAELVRVRATAHGRVQMVGYRAFVLRHAYDLGLHGLVANREDGSVECVVEGPRGAVDVLIDKLRSGPYHARVDALEVVEEPLVGSLPPMTVTA
ncbi:MAG TPA: acylphosphatase [Candidatus Dormibacteraeota bacterium]|jgi:acylphosphatase|nr:acylphosphatase [Candidatus Dormibacteraeota bacterium]